MRVHATMGCEVTIDPKTTIRKMLDQTKGDYKHWVTEEDGKYYTCYEDSRCDIKDEITKDKYEYIQNLKAVLKYIEENEPMYR